jgi:tetratricopeptide (TPR) repeat protein
MGDFKGAEGFLRSCVELWPDEAAYQAAFGWALFKKAPSEPVRAKQHLETATRLNPDDADALRWLDIVNRALP